MFENFIFSGFSSKQIIMCSNHKVMIAKGWVNRKKINEREEKNDQFSVNKDLTNQEA